MKNNLTKIVRSLTLLFLVASITVFTLPLAAGAAAVSAPSTASTPVAGGTTNTSAATTQNPGTFKPLTNLPGLTSDSNAYAGGSSTLPGFLSQLYKICIGAAAVFAVIQIMRAGFKGIASNESVLAKSEARDMIQNAVLGLILVLSPYVIFSIINKDILNLDFTKDFALLQSKELVAKDTTSSLGAGTDPHLAAQQGLGKCNLYSNFKNAQKDSSGNAVCSSGQVTIDPSLGCCAVGEVCCADKASTLYLEAYTQVRTGLNAKGKTESCTVGVVQYFGTKTECSGEVEQVGKIYAYNHPVNSNGFAGSSGGVSYSPPSFAHSCDMVKDRSYTLPVDTNNPKCSP